MPSADPPLPRSTGALARTGERTWSATGTVPMELTLPAGPVFVLDTSPSGERWVLPGDATRRTLTGRGACWVLPESPTAADPAWLIRTDGPIEVRWTGDDVTVVVRTTDATLTTHAARPHADVDGAEFSFDLPGASLLADAAAGFYWGTLLPCVVERTTARDYPDAEGFVISTLADTYVGTYPDVDHEFQVKGRTAWGSDLDRDVVRRMLELQLRMMREDPQQLWRDPCAVQPDGTREYHVRRNSLDGSTNAVMFLVTGNVEVVESSWLHVARTKDLDWLRRSITDLEGAASCVQDCIDGQGRLWSDVYYEDQVIKDGRETLAAALAVRSFRLLAELELLLDREAEAGRYREVATALAAAVARPLPQGCWDPTERRFVDWVDRSGVVHDHVHLLANVLPVLFGIADADQTRHVLDLVDAELPEFQRFPTFLAARIADYTDDEIGDGGPYDLCAAGRYWCWDAAFWSWRGQGRVLREQLETVARQGAADSWVMGERYDVGHVYYVDDQPWHGAAHYYEYPCVFSWVLFHEFLGVRPTLEADLLVAPRIDTHGSVRLEQEAYQLEYRHTPDGFTVRNLAPTARTFLLDLGVLHPGSTPTTVDLAAGAEAHVPTPTLETP